MVSDLVPGGPHEHDGPAGTFWRWFVQRDRHLRDASTGTLLDEVLERVGEYCAARGLPPDLLGVEVAREAGERPELVITAYGQEEHFPVVDALVAAAPASIPWKVTALKPALGF